MSITLQLRCSLCLAASLFILSACSKQEEPIAPPIESKLIESVAPPSPGSSPFSTTSTAHQAGDRFLAYQHNVQIEIAADLIPKRLETLHAHCTAQKDRCTLLALNSSKDAYGASGTISVRLPAADIDGFVKQAAESARISSRNTAAENLSPVIADQEQRLAQQKKYREQLQAILSRKDIGPEQLISVARELSTTQNEIEQLVSARAAIQQRLDSEQLDIQFVSKAQAISDPSPIGDALARFGYNFRSSVASVVDFIASLIPWLVILIPGFFGIRRLWRKLRNKTPVA